MQIDPNLPERLDAEYVAEDGSRKRPLMLHRATVGSMERFIGMLIEHYAGAFPVWLAPVQVAVLNITDAQADYCREIAAKLQKALPNQDLRVVTDLRISSSLATRRRPLAPSQCVAGAIVTSA
jgi:threonyl-tRNA synthetase